MHQHNLKFEWKLGSPNPRREWPPPTGAAGNARCARDCFILVHVLREGVVVSRLKHCVVKAITQSASADSESRAEVWDFGTVAAI
jgi:hypothetical protein